MSNPVDEHSSLDLVQSSDFFTELSETEQESVSGGFFLYYNQTNINSSSNHAIDFTGSLGGSDPNGGGANGSINNSGSANYQLTSTTFMIGGVSDQMMFYMLPGLLNFLSLSGM